MEFNMMFDGNGFSDDEYMDIKQCLETLLSVHEGSQPLDRNFGICIDGIVGYPVNVAENMLTLEIMEKVEQYEPRVQVESIKYSVDTEGQLRPQIHFIKSKED